MTEASADGATPPESDQELRRVPRSRDASACAGSAPTDASCGRTGPSWTLVGYSEREYVGHAHRRVLRRAARPPPTSCGRLRPRGARSTRIETRLRSQGRLRQAGADRRQRPLPRRPARPQPPASLATSPALMEREQAARHRAEATSHLQGRVPWPCSPTSCARRWERSWCGSASLRQGGFDPAERERALEIIERSARSLERIIEDLLHASRIAAGGLMLHPQLVDVRSVVQVAVDAALPATRRSRACRLTWASSAEVPIWVKGDPGRLQQAVSNLLSNAHQVHTGRRRRRGLPRQRRPAGPAPRRRQRRGDEPRRSCRSPSSGSGSRTAPAPAPTTAWGWASTWCAT